MITWKRLQSEQKAWTTHNFPPHTFLWPLWGTIEELGELVHSRLKQEQGIRGTKEEHLEKQKDAIGDGVVFLADVCTQKGWDLAEIAKTEGPSEFQQTYKSPAGKSPIRVMSVALATLLACLEDAERIEADDRTLLETQSRSLVQSYLTGLSGYCHEMGWDLNEIIETTWSSVKKRDWRQNKSNGEATQAQEPEASPAPFLPLSEMVKEDVQPTKANWPSAPPPPPVKKAKVQRPEVQEYTHTPKPKRDDDPR